MRKLSASSDLALQMLGGAPGDSVVGGRLEGLLPRRRHAVPGLEVHRQQVIADEVRGQHDLRHHLVELHGLHVRQRVVLAVDGAGLQAGVDLGEGHRRRVGAERAAEELPGVARRHAQLDAGEVGRRTDLLVRLQPHLPRAEEGRPEDLDLHLLLGLLLVLGAEVARPEVAQVARVAEQVGRGQDRPGRDLLGDVLRGDVAHLQVVPLQGDELGALLEERRVEEEVDLEVVLHPLGKGLHHGRADVLVREHRGEPQRGLGLRHRRETEGHGGRGGEGGACLERGTSVDCVRHVLPPPVR